METFIKFYSQATDQDERQSVQGVVSVLGESHNLNCLNEPSCGLCYLQKTLEDYYNKYALEQGVQEGGEK